VSEEALNPEQFMDSLQRYKKRLPSPESFPPGHHVGHSRDCPTCEPIFAAHEEQQFAQRRARMAERFTAGEERERVRRRANQEWERRFRE
jgi:hypothetical protein